MYLAKPSSLCPLGHAQMWRLFAFWGEPNHMQYKKQPLTFEDQADLLLSRGIQANKRELVEKLQAVNYYRLSGYWYPFKQANSEDFKPNTTLDKIWYRYVFDRQLRLLVLDAIERIEVAVRTSLVYHHSHTYGPFGYTRKKSLPNLNKGKYRKLKQAMREATAQSQEIFVKHFQKKYGEVFPVLPVWMLAEVMSFGMMFTFFRGCDRKIKKRVVAEYKIAFGVLESWLSTLNAVRNICAHHARLWNRVLGIKPRLPRNDTRWRTPVLIENDRVFSVLTLLKYMMNVVAPQSKWDERFRTLLEKYSEIPIAFMGIPAGWQDCPFWKQKP